MDFIQHSHCNHLIGKPSDMTDEQCGALPVKLWQEPDGMWATSFWKPNADELAALVAGGCIGLNLRVGARQHPVTSMLVYTKESIDG